MYIESILALQQKACQERGEAVKLELVIMTSDDTHSRTQALLEDKAYFGMQRDQLHLLKQEKVCFLAAVRCISQLSTASFAYYSLRAAPVFDFQPFAVRNSMQRQELLLQY